MGEGGSLRGEQAMPQAPSQIKIRRGHHPIHEVTQERPMDRSRDLTPSITCSIAALTKSSTSSSAVILVLAVATLVLAEETLAVAAEATLAPEATPVAEVEAIPGAVGFQASPRIRASKRGSLTQANRRRE